MGSCRLRGAWCVREREMLVRAYICNWERCSGTIFDYFQHNHGSVPTYYATSLVGAVSSLEMGIHLCRKGYKSRPKMALM